MAEKALVELNVGGRNFTTVVSTLTKHADSRLAKMFLGDCSSLTIDSSGKIFLDRDGDAFKLILDYLRDNQLPLSNVDRERLRNEAVYFEISELVKQLESARTNTNTNSQQQQQQRVSIIADRQKACITLGYRGTFSFGKDGLVDVKFRKLGRILVSGRVAVCREVFTDTLNESRDPDHGDAECRYSSRLYLKHSCLELAFDMLYENGFRLVTSCGTSTSTITGELLKPGVDPEESKWQHYNEFVFVRD